MVLYTGMSYDINNVILEYSPASSYVFDLLFHGHWNSVSSILLSMQSCEFGLFWRVVTLILSVPSVALRHVAYVIRQKLEEYVH